MTESYSLIARLSTFLKLDSTYFIKSGLWSLAQQIIGVTCGLIFNYLIGHYVSKQVFGEYSVVLSVLGMFTFLSLPGMDNALTHSVSRGFDKSLLKSQRLKFRFGLIGSPILLVFAWYYFHSGNSVLGTCLSISALLFPYLNAYTNYPAYLTAKRNFSLLSVLAIFSSLFFVSSMAIGIFTKASTLALTISYLMGLIIPSFISFQVSKKLIAPNAQTDSGLPAYGSFLTLLTVVPWISGNIGNLILAHYIGTEALAVFVVATRFLTAVQKNFVVFYKPVTAKLAAQTPAEHLLTLRKHWFKLMILGGGLSLCLWTVTPYLIDFFFTKSYSNAIFYAQLLSLALIPLPLSWVMEDMLIYQKNKRAQIIVNVSSQFTKISLLFFLIPRFQVAGYVAVILLERFTEPLVPLLYLLKPAHKNQP